MRRLGSRVTIYSRQKTDGRYNKGKIIGIELEPDACYLGHFGSRDYENRFKVAKYKVAYVDCVTQRGQVEWFYEKDLNE